jgi:hypothetical protein
MVRMLMDSKWRKRVSSKSEKAGAESVGGRRSPNSGSQPTQIGGDFANRHLLVEDKVVGITNRARKFNLTPRLWEKLEREAEVQGKLPIFRVSVAQQRPVAITSISIARKLGFDLCTAGMFQTCKGITLNEEDMTSVHQAGRLYICTPWIDVVVLPWKTLVKLSEAYEKEES